jgi:hypothetical protein
MSEEVRAQHVKYLLYFSRESDTGKRKEDEEKLNERRRKREDLFCDDSSIPRRSEAQRQRKRSVEQVKIAFMQKFSGEI